LIVAKRWIEEVSADRMYTCNKCEFFSKNAEKTGYETSRPDPHCTDCGCNLDLKTRCMSCSCPIKKWENVVSEEDWEQIKIKLK
jgi:hypothetical protein